MSIITLHTDASNKWLLNTLTQAQTTQTQGAVQPESNVNGNLVAPSVQAQGSYAGSSSNTNVGYSGGVNYHGGSNLINDIFNVSRSSGEEHSESFKFEFFFFGSDSNCYVESSQSIGE